MLSDLVAATGQQLDIFGFNTANEKSQKLMETMDQLNKRFPNKLKLASEGTERLWKMRRELKSPNYTTDWKDLRSTAQSNTLLVD